MPRVALVCLVAATGCGKTPVLHESTGGTGMRVAAFDPAELSAFLVEHELPPLDTPLAPMELGMATAFQRALDGLRTDSSGASYGRVGKFFHLLELYDQARACYEHAVADEPQVMLWHHYLGHVALQSLDLGEAERRFRGALSIEPSSASASMQLGMVLLRQDRRDEARAALERAAELDPRQPFAPTYIGFIELGEGRLDSAEQWLLRALAARADDPHPHWLLAQVYGRRGEEAKAAEHRRLAGGGVRYSDAVPDQLIFDLRRDTDSLEFLHVAARSYSERRDLPQAIAVLEQIVARDPNVQWKEELAEAYSRAGQVDRARTLCEQAITAAPAAAGPHLALAQIELRAARPQEALASAERALALDPKLAEAHRFAANVLGKLERFEQGLEHADAGLALEPGSYQGHWQRGKLLFALGRKDEAREALEAALAAHPPAADLARLQSDLALLGPTPL